MKQIQKFEWRYRWIDDNGKVSFIDKHCLLMPNEVEYFNTLINLGYTPIESFQRITGKELEGVDDLQLVVRYIIQN